LLGLKTDEEEVVQLLLFSPRLGLLVNLKLSISQIIQDLPFLPRMAKGDNLGLPLLNQSRNAFGQANLPPLAGLAARQFILKLHAGQAFFHGFGQPFCGCLLLLLQALRFFPELGKLLGDNLESLALEVLKALAEPQDGLQRKAEAHDIP
jgi:hypothetical protein